MKAEIEREFINLWNRGKPNAAVALVLNEWREPLRRLAVRRGAHESDAEDIVLAAFHRLAVRYEEERYENIRAVLCTTVSRLAWNSRRDAGRHPTLSMDQNPALLTAADEDHADPECQFASREEALHVRRAVGDLPEPYRDVVQLHYLNEEVLDVDDTASTMGKPKKWVERAITASRQELRTLLRPVIALPQLERLNHRSPAVYRKAHKVPRTAARAPGEDRG